MNSANSFSDNIFLIMVLHQESTKHDYDVGKKKFGFEELNLLMGVSETIMESSVLCIFNKSTGRLLSVILASDTFKKISLVLCKPFEEKKTTKQKLEVSVD